MKTITYAETSHDLGLCKEYCIEEVIVSDKRFSRIARNEDVNQLLKKAKNLGLRCIFEWDILVTEKDFYEVVAEFQKINLDVVDAIRVQDPGVLNYVLECTELPIQLICETGNHNLIGLKAWQHFIGARLERLVLSIELSKEKLSLYSKELDVPIEILALGPILLFYSPRFLLSPLKDEKLSEYVNALADSEESPHNGFPVIQNRHGTFMFHIKNLFLLDKYQELSGTNIDVIRLDLRDQKDRGLIKYLVNPLDTSMAKKLYAKDVIRGYFQINKSDVLFKKLKNYRIQRKDNDYIGEVVETGKPDYMAIRVLTDHVIKLGDHLKMVNPEGKIYETQVVFLKDVKNRSIEEAKSNQLVLMNYRGGVWPKSQIYKMKKAQGESSLRT